MLNISSELSASSYEQVRAHIAEMSARAKEFYRANKQTPCTCGVEFEAKIARLPLEQLKGVAIGAHLAINELIPLTIIAGDDSLLHQVVHNLLHLQNAAVNLVGSDEANEQDEIPL